MGSKSRLANWIISNLPPANTLVDLFAGGCSITHYALSTHKYSNIIANDIFATPMLFKDCVDGRFNDFGRWVCHDEFMSYKDVDMFVRLCYSFGTRGMSYLYSYDIEPYKKALHDMVFQTSPSDTRLAYKKVLVELEKINGRYSFDTLNKIEHLERMERLKNLCGVVGTKNLVVSQKDYRDVEIPADSIIYCDIPYFSTNGYGKQFNHKDFYEWCRQQTVPVFISEYSMPDDFFPYATLNIKTNFRKDNQRNTTQEKMFVLKKQRDFIDDNFKD